MLVRTISDIKKGELHDKLAKVTVTNPGSLWVQLQGGHRKSEPLKRTYAQIRVDKPASPCALAPAAGAKKDPSVDVGAEEVAAQKKLKGVAEAMSIFAKHAQESKESL